ncbi:unnamed protein product, partial [Choristocarpus tenellus]
MPESEKTLSDGSQLISAWKKDKEESTQGIHINAPLKKIKIDGDRRARYDMVQDSLTQLTAPDNLTTGDQVIHTEESSSPECGRGKGHRQEKRLHSSIEDESLAMITEMREGLDSSRPSCREMTNQDFELQQGRLEYVRRYLRNEDPLYVRRNLDKLCQGDLENLVEGDIVEVARRCQSERKEGGTGKVVRVLPQHFYDIKYMVSGGTERGVDGCFVRRMTMGEGSRRSSTPRCTFCNSFVTDCTCYGAWRNSPDNPRNTDRESWEMPDQAHGKQPEPLGSRKVQQERQMQQQGQGQEQGHLGREEEGAGRDGEANRLQMQRKNEGQSQDSGEIEGGPQGRCGGEERTDSRRMGVEHRGSSHEGLVDAPKQAEAQTQSAIGEGNLCNAQPQLMHPIQSDRCGEKPQEQDIERVDSQEFVGAENEKAVGTSECRGVTEEHEEQQQKKQPQGEVEEAKEEDSWSRGVHNTQDFSKGAVVGDPMDVSINNKSVEAHGDVGPLRGASSNLGTLKDASGIGNQSTGEARSNSRRVEKEGMSEEDLEGARGKEGSGEHDKGREVAVQGKGVGEKPWRPCVGDLVEVERRTSNGRRQFGGIGRVLYVEPSPEGRIDVRYHVEHVREKGIDPRHVHPAKIGEGGRKRQTMGRCKIPGCSSFILHCNHVQPGDAFFADPPFYAPASALAGVTTKESGAGDAASRG